MGGLREDRGKLVPDRENGWITLSGAICERPRPETLGSSPAVATHLSFVTVLNLPYFFRMRRITL